MTGRIRPTRGVLIALAVVALAASACGSGDRASASPAGPVVVTFEVVDERFKALLSDPADSVTGRSIDLLGFSITFKKER